MGLDRFRSMPFIPTRDERRRWRQRRRRTPSVRETVRLIRVIVAGTASEIGSLTTHVAQLSARLEVLTARMARESERLDMLVTSIPLVRRSATYPRPDQLPPPAPDEGETP